MQAAAASEKISMCQLLRELAQSFLTERLAVYDYHDHVGWANVPVFPGLAKRKCVGWKAEEDANSITIVSDMADGKLPDEVTSLGSRGFTLSKRDIVSIRRVGPRV